MNYILIALEVIISFIFIVYFYKKYKLEGLYLFAIIIYTLSILLSTKSIEIYRVEIPIGISLVTTIVVISNILVQKHGLEAIKKLLFILIIYLVVIISIILLSAMVIPSTQLNQITNIYHDIISNKIRIMIGIAITPIITIWLNSLIYYQLKREKNNIIISNILTSSITPFIDATLLSLLCFLFDLSLIEIFITISVIYIIKLIIQMVGTVIVYKTRNI